MKPRGRDLGRGCSALDDVGWSLGCGISGSLLDVLVLSAPVISTPLHIKLNYCLLQWVASFDGFRPFWQPYFVFLATFIYIVVVCIVVNKLLLPLLVLSSGIINLLFSIKLLSRIAVTNLQNCFSN